MRVAAVLPGVLLHVWPHASFQHFNILSPFCLFITLLAHIPSSLYAHSVGAPWCEVPSPLAMSFGRNGTGGVELALLHAGAHTPAYRPNTRYTLRITSPVPLKGFLIRALKGHRDDSWDGGQGVGAFTPCADCQYGPCSPAVTSLTHTLERATHPRAVDQFEWISPSSALAPITFHLILVRSMDEWYGGSGRLSLTVFGNSSLSRSYRRMDGYDCLSGGGEITKLGYAGWMCPPPDNNTPPQHSMYMQPFRRISGVGFNESVAVQRLNSTYLPAPRLISNTLFTGSHPSNSRLSQFHTFFGMYLIFDISGKGDGDDARCPFPSAVPVGDPTFDPESTGNARLWFQRQTQSGVIDGKSVHLNLATPALDLSQLYGTSANCLIRTRVLGQLYINETIIAAPEVAQQPPLFLAADLRVNEFPVTTSIDLLFRKEHNRMCLELHSQHPEWDGDDETLFQEARRWVIAFYQKIITHDYLPALLGRSLTPYKGFQEQVDTRLSYEATMAAFRYGHAELNDEMRRADYKYEEISESDVPLNSAIFRPSFLRSPTGLEDILRGSFVQPQRAVKAAMVDSLRNMAFKGPLQAFFPLQDLAALDIQRGRDAGLASYNQMRERLRLAKATEFYHINNDSSVYSVLQQLYSSVDDVDLYVGGLAEPASVGSNLGSTFAALVYDAFKRMRDGDRWWYENNMEQDELDEVYATSMTHLVSRNTHMAGGRTAHDEESNWFETTLPDNVFFPLSALAAGKSLPFDLPLTYTQSAHFQDNYNLQWEVVDDHINFQLTVGANGWIGIGWSPLPHTMKGADIVLVYFRSGEWRVVDCVALDVGVPIDDRTLNGTNDVFDVMVNHIDGITTVKFSRAINTQDPNDKPFNRGLTHFIYAFHPTTQALIYHGTTRSSHVYLNLFDTSTIILQQNISILIYAFALCALGAWVGLVLTEQAIFAKKKQIRHLVWIVAIGLTLGFSGVWVALCVCMAAIDFTCPDCSNALAPTSYSVSILLLAVIPCIFPLIFGIWKLVHHVSSTSVQLQANSPLKLETQQALPRSSKQYSHNQSANIMGAPPKTVPSSQQVHPSASPHSQPQASGKECSNKSDSSSPATVRNDPPAFQFESFTHCVSYMCGEFRSTLIPPFLISSLYVTASIVFTRMLLLLSLQSQVSFNSSSMVWHSLLIAFVTYIGVHITLYFFFKAVRFRVSGVFFFAVTMVWEFDMNILHLEWSYAPFSEIDFLKVTLQTSVLVIVSAVLGALLAFAFIALQFDHMKLSRHSLSLQILKLTDQLMFQQTYSSLLRQSHSALEELSNQTIKSQELIHYIRPMSEQGMTYRGYAPLFAQFTTVNNMRHRSAVVPDKDVANSSALITPTMQLQYEAHVYEALKRQVAQQRSGSSARSKPLFPRVDFSHSPHRTGLNKASSVSLSQLLTTDLGIELMKDELTRSHGLENLWFYLDVQKYKQVKHRDLLLLLAQEMMKEYILDNSPNQINLSFSIVQDLLAQFHNAGGDKSIINPSWKSAAAPQHRARANNLSIAQPLTPPPSANANSTSSINGPSAIKRSFTINSPKDHITPQRAASPLPLSIAEDVSSSVNEVLVQSQPNVDNSLPFASSVEHARSKSPSTHLPPSQPVIDSRQLSGPSQSRNSPSPLPMAGSDMHHRSRNSAVSMSSINWQAPRPLQQLFTFAEKDILALMESNLRFHFTPTSPLNPLIESICSSQVHYCQLADNYRELQHELHELESGVGGALLRTRKLNAVGSGDVETSWVSVVSQQQSKALSHNQHTNNNHNNNTNKQLNTEQQQPAASDMIIPARKIQLNISTSKPCSPASPGASSGVTYHIPVGQSSAEPQRFVQHSTPSHSLSHSPTPFNHSTDTCVSLSVGRTAHVLIPISARSEVHSSDNESQGSASNTPRVDISTIDNQRHTITIDTFNHGKTAQHHIPASYPSNSIHSGSTRSPSEMTEERSSL